MTPHECAPIDLLAVSKHFISTEALAAEWFMWHADDKERIEYLRSHGFPNIVMIETSLSRDEFDELVEPITTGPWTKTLEILNGGQFRFRVMAAFQNPTDAVMARMVVDR